MGLDMYLSAKKYYSDAEWRPEQNKKDFKLLRDVSGVGRFMRDDMPSAQLLFTSGSWRTVRTE
jgi:hypothetical protein